MTNRIALSAPWWAEMTTTEQNTFLERDTGQKGSYDVLLEGEFIGRVSKIDKGWYSSASNSAEEWGPFDSRFEAVRVICSYIDNQRENS